MRTRNRVLSTAVVAALGFGAAANAVAVEITIATVNNGDMIRMQKLSEVFEENHPDIDLEWVVLEENVLRQRVTTDIATGGGQFDVMTIGTYEVPIWAKQGWLNALSFPDSYDVDDLLAPIRAGLSHEGELYAAPFYGESSMTMYRRDLFEEAGLEMPDNPTWGDLYGFAKQLHAPDEGQFGICLRGKAGWGENMALVSTMINAFGGRWFDGQWQAQLDSPAWQHAIDFYVDLLGNYGPPGASSNGFNENLALFNSGKCAMWVDATVASGFVTDPDESEVADSVGFAQAPHAVTGKGSHWLWAWSLAIPASSEKVDAAETFIGWATSKAYTRLVAEREGWRAAPPGTRKSLYDNPKYQEAAPFADQVLTAIESADPADSTLRETPYIGVQFVAIPEFQGIGTVVGQQIASALTGKVSVSQALESAQRSTERTMARAGYGNE
ncbi:ABC transporter substrate-binding protein [Arhodomonas sp. AD133]|uniref:ABC transporter substrate-binding protein n=1 Tax=Arhodomonas sp. AD133 TaxID=3415009 RepID=UPI003EBEAD51